MSTKMKRVRRASVAVTNDIEARLGAKGAITNEVGQGASPAATNEKEVTVSEAHAPSHRFLSRFSLFSPREKGSKTSHSAVSIEELVPDWRMEVPGNINDPLAINRRETRMQRRVSFADMPVGGDINEETWVQRSSLYNSTHQLLPKSDEPNGTTDGHVNHIFQSEEKTTSNEYFVSAFGTKGKQMGEFEDAKHVTVLPRERLLITDLVNNRVQLCNAKNGKATSVYDSEEIREPWGAAVTKDNYIAVTSSKNKCVLILNSDGDIVNTFGETFFSCPTGIAVDKSGQFVVCDSNADKVSIHDKDGAFVRFLGNSEVPEERLSKPRYVCVSVTGDILVSDSGHHKIKIFNSEGVFIKAFGAFGKETRHFKYPYGVCTNTLGDIFVADHYNNRITMFTRDGVFIRHLVTAEQGLVHPQGVAISPDLHLYVTHGHLKASEILVFKLNCTVNYENIELISHV